MHLDVKETKADTSFSSLIMNPFPLLFTFDHLAVKRSAGRAAVASARGRRHGGISKAAPRLGAIGARGAWRVPCRIIVCRRSADPLTQAVIGPQATGVPYPANGRPYTSGMRTTSQSVIKRQKVSQGEAPNPVVFVATKDTRYFFFFYVTCSKDGEDVASASVALSTGEVKLTMSWCSLSRALRKHLTQSEMRRAARKPHLLVRIKLPPPPRSLAMPLLPCNTNEPIVLED